MRPFRRVTLHGIVAATSTDIALQLGITVVQTGCWYEANYGQYQQYDIESFDRVQNELTVTSDGRLLYRGKRLDIPRSLQLRVMKVARACHLGF